MKSFLPLFPHIIGIHMCPTFFLIPCHPAPPAEVAVLRGAVDAARLDTRPVPGLDWIGGGGEGVEGLREKISPEKGGVGDFVCHFLKIPRTSLIWFEDPRLSASRSMVLIGLSGFFCRGMLDPRSFKRTPLLRGLASCHFEIADANFTIVYTCFFCSFAFHSLWTLGLGHAFGFQKILGRLA